MPDGIFWSGGIWEEYIPMDRAWLLIIALETVFMVMIFAFTGVPWWGHLIVFGASALTAYFLYKIRLYTKLDREGILIDMQPSLFYGKQRMILWRDIESLTVRKLSGFMETSNYGKHAGKNKTVYHLGGNSAIEVTMRDGGQIVIGTRRGNELIEMMQKKERP